MANKSTIISSILWKLLERSGTQLVQFIVQIMLARLLLPEDFGIIALILVFINIATVFVQSGLNTALIQKKEADDMDFSSVLYISLFIAGVFYIILYFASPYIADFYAMPLLLPVIRILSITLFFGAVNSIQVAYVARNMQFKKLFYSSFGAIILSGTVGVYMAWKGCGAWALVAQQLANQLMVMTIMWFTVQWRPHCLISFTRLKGLFSFGWKLLVSGLISTIYNNIYTVVIGKAFSAQALGYYNRGLQFPYLITANISDSIQIVMLPVLSASQDDKMRVKAMMRRSIVTSSLLLFPALAGLAACAESLVMVLLTEKWLPCVPFLQIMCYVYALHPIQKANLQAVNALGRSDIFLKLEIIKVMIGIVVLILTVPYGLIVMVAFQALTSTLSSLINAYPNRKLLNYGYWEQIEDILPPFGLSVVMGVIVWCVQLLNLTDWLTLLIQIPLGVTIYFALVRVFKLESYWYLKATVMEMLDKGNRVKIRSE